MIGAFIILGVGLICVGLWFAYCAIMDAVPNRWEDFAEHTPIRDRQHQDRMAANNDKTIVTFEQWPEVTEDRLKSIYHGEG